jgi:hypothetical protein
MQFLSFLDFLSQPSSEASARYALAASYSKGLLSKLQHVRLPYKLHPCDFTKAYNLDPEIDRVDRSSRSMSRVNLYWTLAFTPTSTYWDCFQTTNTYHDVSLRHRARVFKALYLFSVNFSVYRLWNLGLSMIPHNIGVNLGGWGS